MSDKHLLVALTAHGYGHAAQTADAVNALRARFPSLRLTIWTQLPRTFLATRFYGEFDLTARATDVGMVMASAVEVRVEESAQAYAAFHRGWERRVDAEAHALERLAPDLVLANIPYLVLAGAARAGIPAIGMCSLNWAGIGRHYFHGRADWPRMHAQMLAAYRSAPFLQVEPAMPMPDLDVQAVGPCARIGRERRAELRERLGLSANTRIVLVAPGGMELRPPIESWPEAPGIRFVVPESWQAPPHRASAIESLGIPFTDLLRSSDAIVGKPGYGTFAEAACNATPMLFIARRDWPEAPALVEWLRERAVCAEIGPETLARGELRAPLDRLWGEAPRAAAVPAGVTQVADRLAMALGFEHETRLASTGSQPVPLPAANTNNR
jgi:hypothetical protein